jgi:hypothetical protein
MGEEGRVSYIMQHFAFRAFDYGYKSHARAEYAIDIQ